MTLPTMVDGDAALREYMQRTRTVAPEEVARRTALHDTDDLSPAERMAYETGSMRRVQ